MERSKWEKTIVNLQVINLLSIHVYTQSNFSTVYLFCATFSFLANLVFSGKQVLKSAIVSIHMIVRLLSSLQACARGYLVRKVVCKAREDFEDIVKEIDGRLTHLKWTDTLISIPQFIDTVSGIYANKSDV